MCLVCSIKTWGFNTDYYYSASASVSPSGAGTAYVSKTNGDYNSSSIGTTSQRNNNTVTLHYSVTPDANHELDHWEDASGNYVGTTNPLTRNDLTISSTDQNSPTRFDLTAVLRNLNAAVKVQVVPGQENRGSVSIDPSDNDLDNTVTLTATPKTEDGMVFLGWTKDDPNSTSYISNASATYSFTVSNDNKGTYYAHFKEPDKAYIRLQNISTGKFLSLYGNSAASEHYYDNQTGNPDGFTFDGSLKLISETEAQGNPMTVFMRMGTEGNDFTDGNLKAAGVAYSSLINNDPYPLTIHKNSNGNYVVYTTHSVKKKKFYIKYTESNGGFGNTTYYLGTNGYFATDSKVEWEMDNEGYISTDGYYLIYNTSSNSNKNNSLATTTSEPNSENYQFAFDENGNIYLKNSPDSLIRHRNSSSSTNNHRAYVNNNTGYSKAIYEETNNYSSQSSKRYSYLCDEGSEYAVMKALVTTNPSQYKNTESVPESAEWRIIELTEDGATQGAFGANAKAANEKDGKYYTTMFSYFPYKLSSGVKAYYLPMDESMSYDRNANKVTLTEVSGGIVPANTAVVLECDAVQNNSVNNLLYPIVDESTVQALGYENLLRGYTYVVGRDQQIANNGENMYILATKNGKLAFYHSSGDYMSPNKAFLDLTNLPSDLQQAAKTATFSFGDIDDDEEGTVTGIKIAEGKNNDSDGAIYDLLGRKVENPGRGIYIRNNKKFVVK